MQKGRVLKRSCSLTVSSICIEPALNSVLPGRAADASIASWIRYMCAVDGHKKQAIGKLHFHLFLKNKKVFMPQIIFFADMDARINHIQRVVFGLGDRQSIWRDRPKYMCSTDEICFVLE